MMRHEAAMQAAISEALSDLREPPPPRRKRFSLWAFMRSLLTMEIL